MCSKKFNSYILLTDVKARLFGSDEIITIDDSFYVYILLWKGIVWVGDARVGAADVMMIAECSLRAFWKTRAQQAEMLRPSAWYIMENALCFLVDVFISWSSFCSFF